MDAVEAYVVEALRDYDPDRIVVFGSRARGRATPDSDVDLLVVKDDPRRAVERIHDVLARLYRADRRHIWRGMPPFEALVCTPAEVRERLALGDPFFRVIFSEGRTLMERGRDAA